MIKYKGTLIKIGNIYIVKLPMYVSSKIQTRGLAMIEGTINGLEMRVPLEPDGKGSHWLKVEDNLRKKININEGESVELEFCQTGNWPEPALQNDIMKSLEKKPKAKKRWDEITTNARWDWKRWIGSTKNPETKAKRIKLMVDKLNRGDPRPCCFNRSMCTDPEVSKNGILVK